MSGLEVFMLATGIVSAFAGTASYLQERKKRKAEKMRAKRREMNRFQKALTSAHPQKQHEYDEMNRFLRVLESAHPQIQHEYDTNSARIGSRFAAGDSIGREQLYEILVTLQQGMIVTLKQQLRKSSSAAHVDYSSFMELSERSRVDSISALASQYQRLRTAATIPCTPSYPINSLLPVYSMSARPQYTISSNPTSGFEGNAVRREPVGSSYTYKLTATSGGSPHHFAPSTFGTNLENPQSRTSAHLPTTSSTIFAPTQNASASQSLSLAELPAHSSATNRSQHPASKRTSTYSRTSTLTGQLTSSSNNPTSVSTPATSTGDMFELIHFTAKKATSASNYAKTTSQKLLSSFTKPSDTKAVITLTSQLDASAANLERGAHDLLRITKDFKPAALESSAEARNLVDATDKCICATQKLIACGERLVAPAKIVREEPIRDREGMKKVRSDLRDRRKVEWDEIDGYSSSDDDDDYEEDESDRADRDHEDWADGNPFSQRRTESSSARSRALLATRPELFYRDVDHDPWR